MKFFCYFPYCSLFELLYFITKLHGQVTEQEVSLCKKGEIWLRNFSFQEGERMYKVKVQRNRGFFRS